MKATLRLLLYRLFGKGTLLRGVTQMMGGTIGGRLIVVLAMPAITRLYNPSQFGVLAVFTAMVTIVSQSSAGRYEQAIPLPEKDEDAAHLLVLSLTCVAITAITTTVLLLFFGSEVTAVLKIPELTQYLWIVPLGIAFVGVYLTFERWAVRTKAFGKIAKTKLLQGAATVAVQLGAFKLGTGALLIGQASGQSAGAISLARSAFKIPALNSWSWQSVSEQARRYKKFPIFSVWSSLLNSGAVQLLPIALVSMYGSAIAGVYALVFRVVTVPLRLVGRAVGNAFLSEAPNAYRQGRLAVLVSMLHVRLAAVGAIPLVILLFFSPNLFGLVFGEQWHKAGLFAQWMAPWLYLQFQWSPLSHLSTVLEIQGQALMLNVFDFVLRFGTLVATFTMGYSPVVSIAGFSIVSVIVYVIRMLWFTNKAGVTPVTIFLTELKVLAPMVALAALIHELLP